MPLGVPKVTFRWKEDKKKKPVDLYNRLYHARLIMVCHEINDEMVNQVLGILVYLCEKDQEKDLFVYIHSPGGSIAAGISLYDTIGSVETKITTVCLGLAASMAAVVLTGGYFGKRLALPNSYIMIHQPEGGSTGQADDVDSEAGEVEYLRLRVIDILSNSTGQSISQIISDMNRDDYFTAWQARDYGLIDEVVTEDTPHSSIFPSIPIDDSTDRPKILIPENLNLSLLNLNNFYKFKDFN